MNRLIDWQWVIGLISNVSFDEVSQFAHFFTSYAIVLTACLWGTRPGLIIGAGMVLFAALKEFWFDAKYEDVETRGSSPRDFAFYASGVALAFAVYAIRLAW